MFLVTYIVERQGKRTYGMQIHLNPIEFISECQDCEGEVYYLINATPISIQEALIYDGKFKGM